MRKPILMAALVLAVPALTIPAAATAAHKPKHAPTVQYVIKGTVSSFTAGAPGSIQIVFEGGNAHAKRLFTEGSSLTFTNVTADTKVVSLGDIAPADTVLVKVRASKSMDATALQAALARQIVELSD